MGYSLVSVVCGSLSFILLCGQSFSDTGCSSIGAQDPVSTYFDKTYDAAYNLTLEAGDAKHVRWRRIDYLDVTEITTRWGIWKCVPLPFIPFLS